MTNARKPKLGAASSETPRSSLPRARTTRSREEQLAAMTYDLVEQQIRAGTASSQVLTHFLKVGSTREKIELEKTRQETILVEAKVKDLANVEDLKRLYAEAMDAMRGYGGQDTGDDSYQNPY